jgi:hypothetical protein
MMIGGFSMCNNKRLSKENSNMNEWFKISQFLYNGIFKKIEFYKSTPDLATENNLKELKNALKIYEKNCIVSGLYLREAYNDLLSKIKT